MPEWRRMLVEGAEDDLAAQCVQVLFLVLQGLSVNGATSIENEATTGEDFDDKSVCDN
jgi:hypothetical protein